MKLKICCYIMLILFINSCKDKEQDEVIPTTKAGLLTAGGKKEWRDFVDDLSDTDCKKTRFDDTWTFFSDGKFMYDRGVIIEDSDNSTYSCTDPVNHYGNWQLTNSNTKLKITITGLTDYPDEVVNEIILDSYIELLTDKELILVDTIFNSQSYNISKRKFMVK